MGSCTDRLFMTMRQEIKWLTDAAGAGIGQPETTETGLIGHEVHPSVAPSLSLASLFTAWKLWALMIRTTSAYRLSKALDENKINCPFNYSHIVSVATAMCNMLQDSCA
jgi:hypothetical protein